MITLTSENKNNLTLTGEERINSLTWDESDFTWDESTETWDLQGNRLIPETKNNLTLSAETK